MTDAYFYVNIPYHRPATPSFFRLLQRWAGPLLLGTGLAALAWHQDHLAVPSTPSLTAQAPVPAPLVQSGNPDLSAYSVAADPSTTSSTADSLRSAAAVAGAHPALVFHNCSMPRMEVRKDHNDLITGVASVSSCDEAKVTLWDSSR